MSKVWEVAQWLLRHSAQVPAILAAVDSIGDATTFVQRAEPAKQIIDIVAPILDDFPELAEGPSIMEAPESAALEEQVTAAGFDFAKLLAAAERLAVMIPILLELFKGMTKVR